MGERQSASTYLAAHGRTAAFFLAAALVHVAALSLMRWPEFRSPARPPAPTLDVRLTVPALRPERPEPEPEPETPRQTQSRDRQTRDAEADSGPGTREIPDRSTQSPPVEARDLFRQVPDVRNEPHRAFRTGPEPHSVFEGQRIIQPSESLAPLPDDMWMRSMVVEERRMQTADGRGVIIRRFDNGDIQVCERPHDNPFERWDDTIPYACER